MTKIKKLNILIFAIVLALSSLLFVACGKTDYSGVSLSASQNHIEVFVGQEESLTITIENPVNKMSKLLTYSSSSDVVNISEVSNKSYSTTYAITGVEGGNATISFVSVEGAKSITIDVTVRKYSEKFESTPDLLFVTEQNEMRPSKTDFKFDDNVSERELEFYFYGKHKIDAALSDVQDEDAYVKEFVSVKLSSLKQNGTDIDGQFLIFEDNLGNLFTTMKKESVESDVLYFLAVTKIDEDYTIAGIDNGYELYSVGEGEKFTFVARYQAKNAIGEDVELGSAKHFVVYDAIPQASHDVSYKDKNKENVSFNENNGELSDSVIIGNMYANEVVTFIPYYTPEISGKTVDFLTSYVVVKSEGYNEHIKVKAYSEDTSIVTASLVGESTDHKTRCYQLTCAKGEKANTNFVVQFYYEGFEKAESSAVNYQYKIPVEIRNIPNALIINNVEHSNADAKGDYVFFNKYVGEAGWQKLNIEINPANAEYSSFGIDLTNTNLVLKYNGIEYAEDDLDEGILYINPDVPVLVRGESTAATVADGKLPIIVGIDIFKEDTLIYNISYTIKKGATSVDFEDTEFDTYGIYLDIDTTSIDFSQYLIADADYQTISIKHVSGENVVSAFDAGKTDVSGDPDDGDLRTYINLTFKPNKTSKKPASYQITLDNGVSKTIKVYVIETLKSISVETSNKNNLIKQTSGDPHVYYAYNGGTTDNKILDFNVYANDNRFSDAISEVKVILTDPSTFNVCNQSVDGKEFEIQILKDGKLESNADDISNLIGLVVQVSGNKVSDFKVSTTSQYFPITLYSYSHIDDIATKQIIVNADGDEEKRNANYVDVYTNIKNEQLRKATLSFDIAGEGYIFYNYATKSYDAENFANKYIYWEASIGNQSGEVLYHDGSDLTVNSLTLKSGTKEYGTFILDKNSGRLNFIASESLNGGEEIYLLTHVRQWGKVFTDTTRIRINSYTPVDAVDILGGTAGINLSALNKQASLIAEPVIYNTGKTATNPRLNVVVESDHATLKGLFANPAAWTCEASYDEGTSKTRISLVITDPFVAAIADVTDKMEATLKIYAEDWIENGSIVPDYKDAVVSVKIRFENGTENNRLSIKTAEDLLTIKDNLSAHYQVVNEINVTSILDSLPLGNLVGSIVGTKDYAKISGLNFTDPSKTGLFGEIATTAYIKNLSFEGSFNWASEPSNADIGLVAATNGGTLENISVVINESSITLTTQNFGGIVGTNAGKIHQDFSLYDDVVLNNIYEDCTPKTLVFFTTELNITSNDAIKVGGIAGVNSGEILKTESDVATYYGYTNYTAYTNIIVTNIETNPSRSAMLGGVAGSNEYTISGVLVGGLVSGYGRVGGVAGDSTSTLQNLTTRTFVRSVTGALAIVAHTSSASGIKIEAVDDARYGREASMAIVYDSSSVDEYKTSEYSRYFGRGTSLTSGASIYSYVVRENIARIEDNINDSVDLSQYYGDFIIVASGKSGVDELVYADEFTKVNVSSLDVDAHFSNKMNTDDASVLTKVFYAYHFNIASFAINSDADLSDWQKEFDTKFNALNIGDTYYPFEAKMSDVIFNSKNPDILTISQNGNITVKGTGLVKIQAISLLNTNEGLDFYIYVVNYINKNSSISIVYPNTSLTATPLDDATITLRADNTAILHLRPDYAFDDGDTTIASNGRGQFNGVTYNLSRNEQITANIEYDDSNLTVSVSGQEISITRKDTNAVDGVYSLKIQPQLACDVEGDKFTANINKYIDKTSVDYKKGAISIINKFVDSVGISTAADVEDVLLVTSTADAENLPLYTIIDWNSEVVQTNIDTSDDDKLFDVIITKDGNPKNIGADLYNHHFALQIKVDQKSDAFKERNLRNIYGEYTFIAYAESNMQKTTSFVMTLSKTDIMGITIDNYTKLSDAVGALPNKSDKVYPGESGVLAIYVSPVDADYDSIVIKNDDINYNEGHSNAEFTLLARKSNAYLTYMSAQPDSDSSLFESKTITGSQIANGLQLRLSDIEKIYSAKFTDGTEEKNKYELYNGVVYVRYDFSSENVVDESISRVNVEFLKDGQTQPIESDFKELTVKLQQYVGLELVGKTKNQESGYYSAYTVASGLKYQVQINTYGFSAKEVTMVSSNSNLGEMVEENGQYYLVIKSPTLTQDNNKFNIFVEAVSGERKAVSKTLITVQDFVITYDEDVENAKNPDVVEGMGNGIINIQIGTQKTFAIDIYDYIEYDATNSEVVNKIEYFLSQLTQKAEWKAHTNLQSDMSPDSSQTAEEGEEYIIKNGEKISNYYFKTDGLNIIPVHVHKPIEGFYYFTMEVFFKQNGTNYAAYSTNDNSRIQIKTKFEFNVYSSSSDESPIPIKNYEELSTMYSGSYYILINDILLPSNFVPLNGNFASLDGNGNTIHFQGSYDFGNAEEMGVFKSIESGTIVKNLNVNFMQKTSAVSFATSAETYTFGAITATNNGIITNCHVFSTVWKDGGNMVAGSALDENSDFSIVATKAGTNRNYIGGLVGINSGYITNSSVKLDIKSTATIAGIAVSNSGKIAATAFKQGTLYGEGANQNTAGFVYNNSSNGQIITSFVSGEARNDAIYSAGSKLYSSQPSAGFAFVNEGSIRDCYSDISMETVAARNAGFVYTNRGLIKNSFSLSIIKSNNTSSAGFVMESSGENASLTNCYYYYDATEKINTALAQVDKTFGITRLEKTDFANMEYFVEYSFTPAIDTKSIWFYANTTTSNDFIEGQVAFNLNANKELVSQVSYKNHYKTLASGRLELTSANIFAYSKREWDQNNLETNPETGEEIYHYLDSADAPNRGTIHNPLLINSAKQMEDLFMENATAKYINTANYRIVCDIDYSNEKTGIEGYSNLYKLTFAGILEGNGMEIQYIGLVSMSQLTNAGLFAQVGAAASKIGSIKNLTISPREVAYSSTSSVGTLAGVLNYGYIYDISVSVDEGQNMTVTGQNFVGGIVGRAINSFEIKNVYSNINASAGNNPKEVIAYYDFATDYSSYSYAGSIAGYVGNGAVYNAYVSGVSSVMGARAGFAYGGIGTNADVNYTYVTILDGCSIKAYDYGGFICGDVMGKLNYSYVNGVTQESASSIFTVVPSAALAVGGISGKLSGGTISNAVMSQGFKLANDDSGKTIEYVGGLVGIVAAEKSIRSVITDSIINASVGACTNLGGMIGNVTTPLFVDSVAVKSAELTVSGQKANPKLGGFIASISSDAVTVSIANSYSTSKLIIDTYTSGTESSARVGGFIAHSGNIDLSMRSCYTSSEIVAQVCDIRKVEDPVDFSEKNEDANKDNCLRKVSFRQNITKNDKINEVYYLGSSSLGYELDGYSVHTQKFVEFKAKSKSVDIGLIVEQYGLSSMQYTQGAELTGDAANSDKAAALYGLYGADFDYVDYGADLDSDDDDKHFMLRYNPQSKLYDAYDATRLYILENAFEWDAASSSYIKTTPLRSLTSFEDAVIEGTSYDTSLTNIKRKVLYYDKDNDAVIMNGNILTVTGGDYKYDDVDGQPKWAKWDKTGGDFVLDGDGKKQYLDVTGYTKKEILGKQVKRRFVKLNEKQEIYSYDYNVNNSSQLKIQLGTGTEFDAGWYCTETVDTTEWTEMSLYKDAEHNIYKAQYDDAGVKVVYKNIVTGTDSGTVELIKIWNTDLAGGRLTYLCIEDNLGWLNKK